MGRRRDVKKREKEQKQALKEQQRQERKALKREQHEFKPKSNVTKKIIATVFWLIILFFFAKGLITSFTAEDSVSVKDTMDKHMTELSLMKSVELEAGTFAENFAYEYFTFTAGDAENWTARLQKYSADNVAFPQPTGADSQEVIGTEIKKIDIIDDENADVDVSVRVEYTKTETVSGKPVSKTQSSVYIVRVPLGFKNGNVAVISTPMYVADENSPTQVEKLDGLSGEAAAIEETNQVKKLAASFFNAYYGTKPSELKYYITKDFGSYATAGGNLKFKEIKGCDAVQTTNGYKARVELVVSDGLIDLTQTCFIDVEKGAENRLYVSGLTTR